MVLREIVGSSRGQATERRQWYDQSSEKKMMAMRLLGNREKKERDLREK